MQGAVGSARNGGARWHRHAQAGRQGQRPGVKETPPCLARAGGQGAGPGSIEMGLQATGAHEDGGLWGARDVRRRLQLEPSPAPWPAALGQVGVLPSEPPRGRSHACPPHLAAASARRARTLSCRRVRLRLCGGDGRTAFTSAPRKWRGGTGRPPGGTPSRRPSRRPLRAGGGCASAPSTAWLCLSACGLALYANTPPSGETSSRRRFEEAD